MIWLELMLILYLAVCLVGIHKTQDLLVAVLLFGVFSLVMSVLWLLLKAPDVALTEAAIGAGVTTVLFLAVIARTRRMES